MEKRKAEHLLTNQELQFKRFGLYLMCVCQELKNIWGYQAPLLHLDADKVDAIYEGFKKRVSVEDTAYKVNSL